MHQHSFLVIGQSDHQDRNVESTENFQTKAFIRNAAPAGDRMSAREYRRHFRYLLLVPHFYWSLRRKLSRIQAQLADVIANRRSLLAKIEMLERDMQRVQSFAYHDELTGLPNRRLLEDRYRLAVAISERQREDVALLFIDIDRFKTINDVFGHDFADRVLRELALRITGCIRASDVACRYGGDEFVVLLSGNRERPDAASTATKIRARLSVPIVFDAQEIAVTVSIGIALYPADGSDLVGLVKAADKDMYERKGESAPHKKSDLGRAAENSAFTNEGAPPEKNQ
jgi:diguanylate cyclase